MITNETNIRKNHRLKLYNYSSNGYYFITICTKNKKNLFWSLVSCNDSLGKNYSLSYIGKIVDKEINKIYNCYDNVEIDKYVIMPNHLHMIIVLNEFKADGKPGRPQVAPTIGRIMQQFKGSITKQLSYPIWQKSFYDHIIRNEKEYENIWKYIDENPLKWENDKYFCD